MTYPVVGDSFSSATELKLALHRAALPYGVRLVVKRAEATICQLVCNGRGYPPTCSMRFTAHLADKRWVIRTATLEHSHAFTPISKLSAAESSASAIQKLEQELRGDRDDSPPAEHSSDSELLSDSSSGEEGTYSPRPMSSPRPRPQKGNSFPPAAAVVKEIAELIASRSGILPLPTASMSFSTSRELLIYLHASAQQHDFTMYLFRASDNNTEVKLYCRLGHSQASHRPLCQARYHIAMGPDDRWRVVEDTITKHTHLVLDDAGRPVLPGTADRVDEKKERRPAEPSKKRPRLSEPKPVPSPRPQLPQSTSMPRIPSTTYYDHLKPPLSASPRPSPSSFSSFSAPAPPPPRPKNIVPTPPLNTAFLPVLSVFLASLSPRLASLAHPLLHQGGLDSLERLLLFLSLSDEARDSFLKDVQGVALLQRHLLNKELRRAKEGGWAVGGGSRRASTGVGVGAGSPGMHHGGVGGVSSGQGFMELSRVKKEM